MGSHLKTSIRFTLTAKKLGQVYATYLRATIQLRLLNCQAFSVKINEKIRVKTIEKRVSSSNINNYTMNMTMLKTVPILCYCLISFVPSTQCLQYNYNIDNNNPTDYSLNGRSFTDMASNLARTLGMEHCGHMAICDAHARYRDYGIIALPLILLFPGSRTSDGEPASEWQEAALRGKAREECYSRYNCLINPMWILNFFYENIRLLSKIEINIDYREK